MKNCFLISFLILKTVIVLSQVDDNVEHKFKFSFLTFHSRADSGKFPNISLTIDLNKNIDLERAVYNSHGRIDTTLTGAYKGIIDQKNFDKLIKLLEDIDLDSLKFQNVQCCGVPIKTLIVAYNGKYTHLKSMTPPSRSLKLISFLTKLATTISLPRYKGAIDFIE